MNKIRNIFLLLSMTIYSFSALAEDTKGGLPQLDFSTYPSLIFWSIVTLLIGYILMEFIVLPKIKFIIILRESTIQSDLIKAKNSNNEAEKIKLSITKTQEEAKLQSKALISKALLDFKSEIQNIENVISSKINDKIIKAEQQIAKSKKEALSEIITNT